MVLFWFSCLAAGLSIWSFVWVITRPVATHDGRAHQTPDRLFVRILWPWVSALSPLVGPMISWKGRQALSRRIRLAGLDARWQPDHVVALQVLGFCVPAFSLIVALSTWSQLTVPQQFGLGLILGSVFAAWPLLQLRDQGRARQAQMLREFPFLLDMTTLCVEAGQNLHGALQQAALDGPDGPLRSELRHALADMRAGMPRSQALNELASRTDLAAVHALVSSLRQADQFGMSLGPLLRSQAEQRRAERFLRAEKLALEAPVKMLFPMVFCIFPCTFLVIAFPVGMKLLAVDY